MQDIAPSSSRTHIESARCVSCCWSFVWLVVLVAGAAAAIYWQRAMLSCARRGRISSPSSSMVKPGATVRAVLAELERAARSPTGARWSSSCACAAGRRSRPAATTFRRRRAREEILRQLAEGRVVLEALTVVEGSTFADMRRALEAHPHVKVDAARQGDRRGHERHRSCRANIPKDGSSPTPIASRRAPRIASCIALAYRKMAEALDAAWARAPRRCRSHAVRSPDPRFDRREGDRARERTAAHRRRVHHAAAQEHAPAVRSRP